MFILLLLLVIAAVGEYFFFNSQVYTYKKKLLLVTRQIEELRNKIIPTNKKMNEKMDIVYLPTTYKIGYAKENSFFYLSPIEDSPSVYRCSKSTKVEIESCAQVLNNTWYNVRLFSSDFIMKGWIKESDIKFVFDENTVVEDTL
ncbi:hypothetical protein [Clostridium oryzae]|uniref:Uncharacterized protein n=1 Tax=Clostridium oryzae TaxID=1450648 RepID=A0A1V4ISK5_9CLOT|nr:hypothetical protein [Clostridium oryzae]OPJ63008.1 hypothetical protein CLORY_13740 [Clostridium oryzae]